MVEAHLLQHDSGEETVACSGPVGKACHGGVQVVALFLCPVVGVNDQLWGKDPFSLYSTFSSINIPHCHT